LTIQTGEEIGEPSLDNACVWLFEERRIAMKRRQRYVAPIAAALLTIIAAGCGSTTSPTAKSTSSSSTASVVSSAHPLEVWVDPPRIPAVKAFEKSYPNIPININTLSSSASNAGLEEKFDLFNQVGSGWPDVIFWPNNSAMAWAAGASSPVHFTANLTNIVPAKIKSGYAKATIAECVINGKWYCLRNDVAPTVLWYNAKLFREWGYQPPTTWPGYEALSLKIAKAHPGYYTGLAGDIYTPDRYLWSSGCPTNDLIGPKTVKIDLRAASCTRVEHLMSTLIAAKVISPDGIFESAAATTVGPKLAMTPGAAWYGQYLFEDTFKIPPGEMTASSALQWPGTAVGTGDEGGGLWSMSDHISGQREKDALKMLEFMATSPKWQVDLSTGLPAWGPDQKPWIARQCSSGYFADCSQLSKALRSAAKIIRPNHENLLYSTGSVWAESVVPGLVAGQSLDKLWSKFETSLIEHAKAVGYTVKTG
jgi:ABC-type glycerol-3-phosphate transport system substrate-binding protein